MNDNTKAAIRLVGSKEFGAAGNPKTTIDRIYVQHNFGKYLTATAGRHDLTVGAGLTYDDVFEGATAMVGKDVLNASVSYGYAPALGYNAVFGGTKDVPGTSNREVSFFAKDQKDNAQLAAYSTIGAKDKQGNDVAEYYRAELNYKF